MKLTSPIMLFVLASAGIHAGLVMMSNNLTTINLPGITGSVMAVKIKEQQTTEIKNDTYKEITTAKNNKHATEVKKSVASKTISTTKSSTQKQNISITQKESRARVISIIYKELKQHFTYPTLAQKRNWQGKVELSLRVTSSGKIEDVQLNNSSGYNILDQAAISSLLKVGNLPKISSWLPYDINLKLPVIYQLTEG